MQLTVVTKTPRLIRVALSGNLDTMSVGHIETKLTALMAGNTQSAIIDMSDVSVITSLGIGMLISLSKMVKRQGGRFVVLKPQPTVALAIQISRLTELLGVADDEATAQSILHDAIAE
jgi:anti-anti-sigma factor